MQHSSPVFADGAVHSTNASKARAAFLRFHNGSSGEWLRLVVAGGAAHGLFYTSGADLLTVAGTARGSTVLLDTARSFEDHAARGTPAWHRVHGMLRRRRRLAVGGPYGRLPGCAPSEQLRTLPLGIVIDHGYVQAASGYDGAVHELATALTLLNGLFEDQLGLRIEARAPCPSSPTAPPQVLRRERLCLSPLASRAHVQARYVVINTADVPFAHGGPNSAVGQRPRASEVGQVVSAAGSTPMVLDSAPAVLLGRFAQWIGAHAPSSNGPPTLWHLMTDSFPAPGVTGLATLGAACMRGSTCATLALALVLLAPCWRRAAARTAARTAAPPASLRTRSLALPSHMHTRSLALPSHMHIRSLALPSHRRPSPLASQLSLVRRQRFACPLRQHLATHGRRQQRVRIHLEQLPCVC